MLLMGDEVRRTQRGNNNAYCQDNEISWFDWTLLERHADIHRFVKLLTAFRQRRDVVTEDRPLTLNELLDRARIEWHGVTLNQPDWSEHSHALAFTFAQPAGALPDPRDAERLLGAVDLRGAAAASRATAAGGACIDTALPAPDDIQPVGRGAARDVGELRGATTLDGALHPFARAAQSGTSCEAVIHMAIDPLAGQPAPERLLVDVDLLLDAYYTRTPDVEDVTQRVRFGTSGHRGSSLRGTFTEAHVLAITQAICDYRSAHEHRWPAVSRQGHACALGAGLQDGARGAGRQRRRSDDRQRRRLHPDAGDLPRDPRAQPPAPVAPRRRHRHHAVAQSARGRRVQIQPADRRPGRYRHHAVDRGASE